MKQIGKVQKILNDLNKYEDYDFNKDVEERLEKTFNAYVEELERSYSRLKCKKSGILFKELSRQ